MSEADKTVGHAIAAIATDSVKRACRGAFALTSNHGEMLAMCGELEKALCDELAVVIVATCGMTGSDAKPETMRIATLLVECVGARIEDYNAFVDDNGGKHERH